MRQKYEWRWFDVKKGKRVSLTRWQIGEKSEGTTIANALNKQKQFRLELVHREKSI